MKKPNELTDEELFEEIREQVNYARNTAAKHDRKRTRALAAEMKKRGWGVSYNKAVSANP